MDTASALPAEPYYELLRETVGELERRGRSCFAASLKPLLKHRSSGGFDEVALGFSGFREFLWGAAAKGVVAVRLGDKGDLEVSIPRDAPDKVVRIGAGERIRRDLWKAWIDWSDAYNRVFDREDGRAYRIPVVPDPADGFTEIRELRTANPQRFVEITPVSREDTLALMWQFASDQGELGRGRLTAALGQEPAAGRFTATVKLLGLAGLWHIARAQQVVDAITAWATANSVEVDILEKPELQPVAVRLTDSHPPAWSEDETRSRVIRAVQQMSMGELLRLPIPVEYMVNR